MTVMPFEGLMDESIEDAEGTDYAMEPTHSDEDEAYYVSSILTGEADEFDADAEGEYMTDETADDYAAQVAGDRWERSYWGD